MFVYVWESPIQICSFHICSLVGEWVGRLVGDVYINECTDEHIFHDFVR